MKCISPLYVKPNVLPCGKCNYCRQLRMLDWSFRLTNEMRYSTTSYFVTLTLRFAPQLGVSKRHIQLFFKRLRARTPVKVVYYAVAEYGARTLRPHYHAIIFNADADAIQRSWKLGRIHVGTVSPQSIAYVANYSLKGSRYPKGCRPPFALMSRRPAIGSRYLDTHTDWHRQGLGIPSEGDLRIDLRGKKMVQRDDFQTTSDVTNFKAYTFVNGQRGHLPRFYRDRIYTKSERVALTQLALKQMDEQYQKEVERLERLGHKSPGNYILENHYHNHNSLLKTLESNETI